MILITTFYQSSNQERNNEIKECLIKNTNNTFIEHIYLLNDTRHSLNFLTDTKKITQIIVDDNNKQRLGFDFALNFINKNLSGKKCILANSDIHFDNSLSQLSAFNLTTYFLTLSRYEDYLRTQMALKWSQDAWIFQSPCKINLNKCCFKFGTLGCDGRINYLAYEAGYKLLNPSKSIFSYHLHKSNYRTYNNTTRVVKPYLWVDASNLNEKAKLSIKTDTSVINL